MRPLDLARPGERLSVLCLGAHSDDIEIGAGGAILHWIESGVRLEAHWCVLSAIGERSAEATASATAFLTGAAGAKVELAAFRDSFFPYQGGELKEWFAGLKSRVNPDIILTHRRDDAHQDHREVCQLTWNAFRDHLILEYEVPKWDGDLGQPNGYIPLEAKVMERKIELLIAHFGTQRSKDWFDAETFRGLARLRGIECRASEGYAEAFTLRKLRL
ncbi:PIG-L deacetylase family protein [Methylocapsa polymorpha]|uniref:PIG-L deacetylase family protein n=1 Tax=Methylocapsa polymorpha TaxID=3080828 RepID=A0ABZ0HXG2_9HYPH|nr:PIG-L deacetylase family protein [Methylocapsa sp. RX1]